MNTNLFNYQLAEVQVSYRTNVKPSERRKVTCSQDAAEIFSEIWSNTLEFKESAYMLLLNRANQVIGYYKISEGGIAGTVIDVKVVFSVALKTLASGIILGHNHPSGNLKASTEDVHITKKISEAAKLFDISLCDHLILTEEGYYSFADEGLL